jgi:hypothetical protein
VDRELPGVVETVPYAANAPLGEGVVVAKGLGRGEGSTAAWVAFWPADPTPVVLRKGGAAGALVGAPSVPTGIADQIPEGRRWWLAKSTEEAEGLRAALIAEIETGGVALDVRKALSGGASRGERFALQKRTSAHGDRWALHVERVDGGVVSLELAGDPRNTTTQASITKSVARSVLDLDGELGRAHRANETGAPIRVQKVDSGSAEVLVNEDDFVRLVLKGERMAGVYELELDKHGAWALASRGAVPANVEVLKRDASRNLKLRVQKVEDEKRLATGVVAEPLELDAHGDFQREETIERAAHRFMARLNRGTGLGLQHSIFGEVGVELVESWIAREDCTINGQAVKKGSWIMTVHVLSEKLWQRIKRGEITGFSFGGMATVAAEEN